MKYLILDHLFVSELYIIFTIYLKFLDQHFCLQLFVNLDYCMLLFQILKRY